jgi:hypothetical protein
MLVRKKEMASLSAQKIVTWQTQKWISVSEYNSVANLMLARLRTINPVERSDISSQISQRVNSLAQAVARRKNSGMSVNVSVQTDADIIEANNRRIAAAQSEVDKRQAETDVEIAPVIETELTGN